MTTITEIKSAIQMLSEPDKSDLKRWLDEVDAEIFDRKIERDAAAGRLDDMIAKAKANYAAGRGTPL
jgi:hypothetical protein